MNLERCRFLADMFVLPYVEDANMLSTFHQPLSTLLAPCACLAGLWIVSHTTDHVNFLKEEFSPFILAYEHE